MCTRVHELNVQPQRCNRRHPSTTTTTTTRRRRQRRQQQRSNYADDNNHNNAVVVVVVIVVVAVAAFVRWRKRRRRRWVRWDVRCTASTLRFSFSMANAIIVSFVICGTFQSSSLDVHNNMVISSLQLPLRVLRTSVVTFTLECRGRCGIHGQVEKSFEATPWMRGGIVAECRRTCDSCFCIRRCVRQLKAIPSHHNEGSRLFL